LAAVGVDLDEVLRKIIEKLDLCWNDYLAVIPEQFEALLRVGFEQPASFAVAAMAAKV
jgi:hypothetical protein